MSMTDEERTSTVNGAFTALPAVRHVETLGYRTAFYEAGAGETVILLHGGGAGADSRSNWEGCFDLFAARARTFAVDLVGFGETDKPDPERFAYTQDARNAQLVAFIEALGLERVTIIGNSMGGATALGVAMTRPDLVANLVLMGSGGLTTHISHELGAVVDYDFTEAGMRRLIGVLSNPGFVPTSGQVSYRYELSVRPDVRAAYRATMGWVKANGLAYTEDQLREVKARTLVVNGKDDVIVPVETAYRFLELLENSTGYILPHCRHWAMIEYPRLFAEVCLDFIEGRGVPNGGGPGGPAGQGED